MTTGTPSLPVKFPNECETASILLRWSLKDTLSVPTSRRQLTTTTPILRLCIRCCVPAWSLNIDKEGALLIQSGVLSKLCSPQLNRRYLQLVNRLSPTPLSGTLYMPDTRWPISRMPSTLSENSVMGPWKPMVTPPVTESMNVAPFTVGWVVTTTRLDPRYLEATPLSPAHLSLKLSKLLAWVVVPRTKLQVLVTIGPTRAQLPPTPRRETLNSPFLVLRTRLLILSALLKVPSRTPSAKATSLCVKVPRVTTCVRHLTRVEDVIPSSSRATQNGLFILLNLFCPESRLPMARTLIGPRPMVKLATVEHTNRRSRLQNDLG